MALPRSGPVVRIGHDADETCPAAGLLDPTVLPRLRGMVSRISWAKRSRGVSWLSSANIPHWAVLVNKDYMRKHADLDRARSTSPIRAPDQGHRRRFHPFASDRQPQRGGRASPRPGGTFALGSSGSPDASPASADGVIRWCQDRFEEDYLAYPGPFSVDVYDSREAPHPSEERLADLSEKTKELVKWFKLASAATSPAQLDLVIIDQLGTMSPAAREGTQHPPSATAHFAGACPPRLPGWHAATGIAGWAGCGDAYGNRPAYAGRRDRV